MICVQVWRKGRSMEANNGAAHPWKSAGRMEVHRLVLWFHCPFMVEMFSGKRVEGMDIYDLVMETVIHKQPTDYC